MAQLSVNPQRFDPYRNFTVAAATGAGPATGDPPEWWAEEVALLALRYYLALPDIPTDPDS